MPRRTEQHTQLISGRVAGYLLEREDTEKRLRCVRSILASLEKARSSERRGLYRQQLDNCFKKLCSDSTDMIMYRDRLKKAREDNERDSRKRAEYNDLWIEEQRKNVEYEWVKRNLDTTQNSLRRSEEDYGELLKEKRELERSCSNLKEQLENTRKLLEDSEKRHKKVLEALENESTDHST